MVYFKYHELWIYGNYRCMLAFIILFFFFYTTNLTGKFISYHYLFS